MKKGLSTCIGIIVTLLVIVAIVLIILAATGVFSGDSDDDSSNMIANDGTGQAGNDSNAESQS